MRRRISAPLDNVFAALSTETRLRIVSVLAQDELCVCGIVDSLQEGQANISRHLAALRRAGLVVGERHGNWIRYSLQRPLPAGLDVVLPAISTEYPTVAKHAARCCRNGDPNERSSTDLPCAHVDRA